MPVQQPHGATKKEFKFSAEELFNDNQTIQKLKPVPENSVDLLPVLDLLIDYGILRRPIFFALNAANPEYLVIVDKNTGKMAKNSLLKGSKDISSFVDNFKKRVANKDPVYPVVSTREIPKAWQGPSVDKTARPRTFAKDVVTLLERLRVKNQDGNAGTYATRGWAEFSGSPA